MYTQHHVIIVTSWDRDKLIMARDKATVLFDPKIVTYITDAITNSIRSFMIAPDGANEGSRESVVCLIAREKYKEWLNYQSNKDNSNDLSWVEVQFNDDNCVEKIVDSAQRHRCKKCAAEKCETRYNDKEQNNVC